jgi:hypothetical protein
MLVALPTERPRPLAHVPGALSRIVLQCLARDPAERPSIAQVDAVLEQLHAGSIAVSDAVTAVSAVARPVRAYASLQMSQPPRPAIVPMVEVRRAPMAAVLARGSDQTLAFAPTVARIAAIAEDIEDEIDDEITAVTAPPVHESAPRWRLAEGTDADQLVGPAVPVAQRRVRALDVVRYLTLAVCLFGIGFVVALAVWSM